VENDEWVNAVITVREFVDDWYLFFTTKKGLSKRTTLEQFANIRRGGLRAINLREDDELISVRLTDGEKQIMIGTKDGSL
ncbi:DNA gyrase C-terminal beta-propeller domain-containing protein, partial [Alkalihalophilus pseudofirmus]